MNIKKELESLEREFHVLEQNLRIHCNSMEDLFDKLMKVKQEVKRMKNNYLILKANQNKIFNASWLCEKCGKTKILMECPKCESHVCEDCICENSHNVYVCSCCMSQK